MKLLSLTIKNFRSIEEETFNIAEVDSTHTFTLIGINESGKSSFLKAVSLVNNEEEKELSNTLIEKGFEKDILSKVKIDKLAVCATFDPAANAPKKVFDQIVFQKKIFEEYTLQGDKPAKKDPQQTPEDFDLEKFFEAHLPKYFWKMAHRIVFWKSDSKHLINEQINLDAFAAGPENISIPLINCFELAGISQEEIP